MDNVALAKGCDAVCLTPCDLSHEVIDQMKEMGIKCLATRSIGYDHIDLDYVKSLGIGASRVEYAPETVADYSIMMMLMCCRNICHILKRADIQDFSLKGKMGKDICDCTVGISGTGRIGQTVIRHLKGFGCKILAYDIYPNEEMKQYADYVSLEELYQHSDIISLHAPATAENYHLLNERAFEQMREGVIIVNTARGSLIDGMALIKALESGKIGHAALDVWEQESGMIYVNRMGDAIANREFALLKSFPNVILAPHTAFYTEKAVNSMAYNAIRCIHDMLDHKENPLVLLYPEI
jgi:D-lactate dehydrogenase